MTTFLFWNVNRKPIAELIATLAREQSVDVLILAECITRIPELLNALNCGQPEKYSFAISPFSRVLVFSRFPHGSIHPLRDEEYLSFRRIKPPFGIEITLAAAHFSSKLHQGSDDQALTTTRFARMIEEVEYSVKHERTVVVGDFNMNPFEAGVAGGEALHAVMDKTIALKISRSIGGMKRKYFYNPMWSRMGDMSPGPPGTYYRQSSKQVNYFWNTFDQILLRPDLISRFEDERFKVITSVANSPLLTKEGIPSTSFGSDHLPLMFGLNLS